MKQNGNNAKKGTYYIGLDVGTNSVGWAASDQQYQLLKVHGKATWGARLFEEAQDAKSRRSSRTARRRLNRQKERLLLLQMLFAEEIGKVDPNFFIRMQESALWPEDKTSGKDSLFADNLLNDAAYFKTYPTAYHLRKELVYSSEPHDIRLVFLALHHIMKSRGHFLYETSDDNAEIITLEQAFDELIAFLSEQYHTAFAVTDRKQFLSVMANRDMGITAKKKAMRELLCKTEDEQELNITAIADYLTGATVSFYDLFGEEEMKKAETKAFSLKNDIEESFDAISEVLGDRIEVLIQLKKVFDIARLAQILDQHKYICDAKVALFEKNKKDLALLKRYVKQTIPSQYRHVFSERKDKLDNFAAYSRYKSKSGDYSCKQEDFCKFLKKTLPAEVPQEAAYAKMYQEIQDGTFLSKLKGSDNGVIPYQLHKRELLQILQNAEGYLPFLREKDADGISVAEKIGMTFEFRIPYYVGPLNKAATHQWAVRFAGKEGEHVYPWNFRQVIDTEASAGAFIENLIGRCTYTGEKVLPKNSLLYSEYMLLNEMNLLRVNGHALPKAEKDQLLQDLFYASNKRVTLKRIRDYMLCKSWITAEDQISGIDITVKTTLRSYHDFKRILEKTGDYDMVESIIRGILIFGEDKKMLRRWLKQNTHDLTEDDIRYICRLKYQDWGNLSETLLTGIYSPDQYGEAKTIMDYLRNSDMNLMQLLSDDFQFAANAEAHRNELLGNNQTLTDKLDALYIAPSVRRSIRQALRIVDEIVDTQKAAPAKIFIEMARDNAADVKKKRTESRKTKLLELYKKCKEESGELFEKLENEDENRLRSDKLYLYYTQFGKCMYSGEPIDFASLASGELYDIDHIFPQSKVKDNSLDNRVLVKNTLNREKTNIYPISADIRTKMTPFWQLLKKAGMISDKKFERLTRSYPLTDKELSEFVARQLVETRQSTKALTILLEKEYGKGHAGTRIVFSKAGNVSDFRNMRDESGKAYPELLKNRSVNDLHHARDAYLNIVVGNVYDTKFTTKFFNNIRQENYSLNRVFDFDTPGAWKKDQTIAVVRKTMAKNNPLITCAPHEAKGQLYNVQPVSASLGHLLEKKTGLPIEKYGGYNKLTGAYFCVVEHTIKGKRVRSIQPVLLYAKSQYEVDPDNYCRTLLAKQLKKPLVDPHVVVRKISVDSLVELDGKRLLITSVSAPDGRMMLNHTYQLAIDSEKAQYLKSVEKYVERCTAQKKELTISVFDGITDERNLVLYDWFIEKCRKNVYADVLKETCTKMEQGRGAFIVCSVLEQCKILMEALKSFKCDAQQSDFSAICDKGKVNRIRMGTEISKLSSAKLIHQSPTGLYEYATDLLGTDPA